MKQEYKYLKFIWFKDLTLWDRGIKQYRDNSLKSKYQLQPLSFVIEKSDLIEKVLLKPEDKYTILGVRIKAKGVFINREALGKDLITETTKYYYKAKANHLFWCKVDTKNGAFGVTNEEHNNCFASHNMQFAKINTERITIEYLQLLFANEKFQNYLDSFIVGTTNRQYIKFGELLEIKIPLPSIEIQRELVEVYSSKMNEAKEKGERAKKQEVEIETYLKTALGIETQTQEAKATKYKYLKFIPFSKLKRWDLDYLLESNSELKSLYSLFELGSLIQSLRNGIAERNFSTSGMKYIRVGNISNNHITDKDLKFTNFFQEDDLLKKDTLLITRKGTVGEAVIVEKDNEMVASSEVFIINLKDKVDGVEIFPQYLAYVNYTSFLKKQYEEKYTGAFMPSISQDKLKSLKFPLPPLEVQKEIAGVVAERKAEIKLLRNEVEALKLSAKQEFETTIFKIL